MRTYAHHFARTMKKLRTPEQVRADFEHRGQSIADWARKHGVSRSLVYEILKGRKKCKRGQCHRVAVLLGLKHGELVA
jgi:gp16 family phage-associated protein